MKKIIYLLLSILLVASPCFGGVDFDGSGDYLQDINVENWIHGYGELSISVWIESDFTNTDRGFLSCNLADNEGEIGMRYDAGGYSGGGTNLIKVAISGTSGNQDYESENNTQTTNVQNLIMVWESGSDLVLYINGTVDTPTYTGTTVTGTTIGCTELRIGDHARGDWDGRVFDVVIWSKALTASEAKLIYDSKVKGITYQIQPASILAYYPLDDFSDGSSTHNQTLKNYIGDGDDLTGTNGTAKAEKTLSYP